MIFDTFTPYRGVLGVLGLGYLFGALYLGEVGLFWSLLWLFRDALVLAAKLPPPWTEPTISPSLSD